MSKLDDRGREVLSSVPKAPPVGYRREPSMIEHVRSLVRQELSRQALEAGSESFEEADDFDVDDDGEPLSAYEFEEQFEPEVPTEVPSRQAAPQAPAGGGEGLDVAPKEQASPAPSAVAEGAAQRRAT